MFPLAEVVQRIRDAGPGATTAGGNGHIRLFTSYGSGRLNNGFGDIVIQQDSIRDHCRTPVYRVGDGQAVHGRGGDYDETAGIGGAHDIAAGRSRPGQEGIRRRDRSAKDQRIGCTVQLAGRLNSPLQTLGYPATSTVSARTHLLELLVTNSTYIPGELTVA